MARVWADVRAPGPSPPGMALLAAVRVGGTLPVIGLLVWLGARHHGSTAWHFYEHRAGTYYSGALLVTAAVLAFRVARRMTGRRVGRFWSGASFGLLYLAADEITAVHEYVDKWLHRGLGWPDAHPITDHIDDAIVILYGIVAVVWALRYRDALLRLRWTTFLLTLAAVGFAVTSALDVLGVSTALEESMKLLTEALIVVAVYAAGRDPALADPA